MTGGGGTSSQLGVPPPFFVSLLVRDLAMSFRSSFVALMLLAIVAVPCLAQEGQKKKKRDAGPPPAIRQLLRKTEGLDLTAEQSTKLKEVVAQYTPKFRELNQKANGLLTDEQKKARNEANAKNKADGKTGKEAAAAVAAALALTPEQQKTQAELQASTKELSRNLNQDVQALLTAEQKAKLKPAGKAK